MYLKTDETAKTKSSVSISLPCHDVVVPVAAAVAAAVSYSAATSDADAAAAVADAPTTGAIDVVKDSFSTLSQPHTLCCLESLKKKHRQTV